MKKLQNRFCIGMLLILMASRHSIAQTETALTLDGIYGSSGILSDTIQINYSFTTTHDDLFKVSEFNYSVGDTLHCVARRFLVTLFTVNRMRISV